MTNSNIALKYAASKYKVTASGKLSDENGKLIVPKKNAKGYPHLSIRMRKLNIDQKITVHRIVAYIKYGDALLERGIVVRHLNSNKEDFSPSNIVIGSALDNYKDNVDTVRFGGLLQAKIAAVRRRKFNDEEVAEIRKLRLSGWTFTELARRFGGRKGHMHEIVNKQIYRVSSETVILRVSANK